MMFRKPPNARALYVFAHGAGAGMQHPFMEAMSEALAGHQIATARYEFPYRARGEKRIDPPAVLEQSVREAVAVAAMEGLPLYAGGKSMGGRMTSRSLAAVPFPGVRGLVFLGFPLHPAGKPSTSRADHLRKLEVPMLFIQGTRDKLADLSLLEPIVRSLPSAELHTVEGADHSFHVLKRSGRTDAQVLDEVAARIAAFVLR